MKRRTVFLLTLLLVLALLSDVTLGAIASTQVAKLVAPDGAAEDYFGIAAAVSGDIVVVGAWADDVGSNADQGSAYIYARNQGGADNWGLIKKITPADGKAQQRFGEAIDIDGDIVIVGSMDDNNGQGNGSGSAYIFARNEGGVDNWGQVKKLVASDSAAWDRFGVDVAIDGDVIVVGANGDTVGSNSKQGSAYLFYRDYGGADNWGEYKKIMAADGAALDYFGVAVSISVNSIAVGAEGDDERRGAVYIYDKDNGGPDNWGQFKKIVAPDGIWGDGNRFGLYVDISADDLAVGATDDDVDLNVDQGSAYIFARDQGGAGNWGEIRHIFASDGATNDRFGDSVGIDGDRIIVGARGNDNYQGAAYLFLRNEGGSDKWGQSEKIIASDGVDGDYFGSVDIDGATIVSGADGVMSGGNLNQGAAYVYHADPTAVTLVSFTAVARSGVVQLHWETASEIDSAGFRIYRGDDHHAAPTLITRTIIPSQASDAMLGSVYAYTDTTIVAGRQYSYWLEDVETNGAVARHGPVSITPSVPWHVSITLKITSGIRARR